MLATYQPILYDAFGTELLVPKDWKSFSAVRVENSVGYLTLTLPGAYPEYLFKTDGLIALYRSIADGIPYLFLDMVWLMLDLGYVYRDTDEGRERVWELGCFDLNILHQEPGRIVDYDQRPTSSPGVVNYTHKFGAADDSMKAIIRENEGASAVDTSRDWSAYLDVQADLGAAAVVSKTFARYSILQVLQELAVASLQNGTYLAFDTICSQPPSGGSFKAEFRTYTGQRGNDHRFPGGAPPVLLGEDFGNLIDSEYHRSAVDEVTRAIVGGAGDETSRPIARSTDAARAAASPFGLREAFYDAYQETGDLQTIADGLVSAGRPTKTLTGTIAETSGMILDVNYGFGDYLTAQVYPGLSFDAHLDKIMVSVDRKRGETVKARLRAEA